MPIMTVKCLTMQIVLQNNYIISLFVVEIIIYSKLSHALMLLDGKLVLPALLT